MPRFDYQKLLSYHTHTHTHTHARKQSSGESCNLATFGCHPPGQKPPHFNFFNGHWVGGIWLIINTFMSPWGHTKAWVSNIDQRSSLPGSGSFGPANADKLQLWHEIVAEIYYWLNKELGELESKTAKTRGWRKLSALWRWKSWVMRPLQPTSHPLLSLSLYWPGQELLRAGGLHHLHLRDWEISMASLLPLRQAKKKG